MHYVKKVLSYFLIFSFVALLASCNVISGLVGDIPLPDVFEMDGKEVTLSRNAVTALESSALAASYKGQLNLSFKDLNTETFSIPSGINPSLIRQEAGIDVIIKVSSSKAESDLPSQVTVAGSDLSVSVKDSDSAVIEKEFATLNDVSVSFSKQSCSVSAGKTICEYSTTTDTKGLLELSLDGEELSDLYNGILTDGTEPNNFTGFYTFAIESDSALPLDAEITITVRMDNATLRL